MNSPDIVAGKPGTRACLSVLALYFLRLGATGFGGPVALCGLMERDLVERRGWLSRTELRDMIAVCQSMPGPLAVQVGIFVGYRRCGVWGAWVAGGAARDGGPVPLDPCRRSRGRAVVHRRWHDALIERRAS